MLHDFDVQDAHVLRAVSRPVLHPPVHFQAVVCNGQILHLNQLEDYGCIELVADYIKFQQEVMGIAERQR